MRVQLSQRRSDRGAVAVIVALLAVVLVTLLAFAADFGMAYAQRQALGTGTDSAALAVVRSEYAAQLQNPLRTCGQIQSTDQAQASSTALTQVNANSPFGSALTGSDVVVHLDCVGSPPVLQVTVTSTRRMNRIFGWVAGSSQLVLNRVAIADLGVVSNPIGVEPIGICNLQAQGILNDAAADLAANKPYRTELISLSKVWSGNDCSGDGGSGNWGWLDLGQGNGESALGNMIANGLQTPLTVSGNPPQVTMGGSPGNKGNGNPVHDGMAAIMDKTVLLPVYTSYSGNGANITYKVNGFLSVKMCGYDKTIKGSCYDSTVPMNGDDMQVKFVSYEPPGQFGGQCFGQACAYDAYVTRLVD
ncbi:MAG: pilus assembly protein TadG-related protein [Mycobacteriaceae bacterium]